MWSAILYRKREEQVDKIKFYQFEENDIEKILTQHREEGSVIFGIMYKSITGGASGYIIWDGEMPKNVSVIKDSLKHVQTSGSDDAMVVGYLKTSFWIVVKTEIHPSVFRTNFVTTDNEINRWKELFEKTTVGWNHGGIKLVVNEDKSITVSKTD